MGRDVFLALGVEKGDNIKTDPREIICEVVDWNEDGRDNVHGWDCLNTAMNSSLIISYQDLGCGL
jgi:hypothetical protein